MIINIQRIQIKKLFNLKDYNIELKENILILFSENGTGKTTILSMIYCFLNKDWNKLIKYDFQEIIFTINNNIFSFIKSDFKDYNPSDQEIKNIFKNFPNYQFLLEDGFYYNSESEKKLSIKEILGIANQNTNSLIKIAEENDIPPLTFSEIISEIDLLRFKKISTFDFDISAIFLPTYRRIEKQFDEIFTTDAFEWKNKIDKKSFGEIKFGLDDVFEKLENQDKQEDKSNINRLFNLCNNYFSLTDKQLIYDPFSEFKKFYLKFIISQKEVNLNFLSSGEKQLLSIFSYLTLNDSTNTILIIDEPEISFSIEWQEKFIPDLLKLNPAGLIIASHSPFIVKNKMVREKFTKGLNEFEVL